MRKALWVELYEPRVRIRLGEVYEYDNFRLHMDENPRFFLDCDELGFVVEQAGGIWRDLRKDYAPVLGLYEPLSDFAENKLGKDGAVTALSLDDAHGVGLSIVVRLDNGHGETWAETMTYVGPYAVGWDTDKDETDGETKA